jgi:hypothetical protein
MIEQERVTARAIAAVALPALLLSVSIALADGATVSDKGAVVPARSDWNPGRPPRVVMAISGATCARPSSTCITETCYDARR